jgi:FkbM family methyltransferase
MVSEGLFGGLVYTSRHGLTKGLRRKGGLGWLPEWAAKSAMTKEHAFWASRNFAGMVVYDVGSFQGLLALFFARTARLVICYEPNDGNRRRLLENIALNRAINIQVRPVAVGEAPGTTEMFFLPLMPGGASIDPATASALRGRAGVSQAVRITTIDDEVDAGSPPPDFLKIDIEGYELEALRGGRRAIARHRPELFLEMHGETIREKKTKVRAIAVFLSEAGYDITHIETGLRITTENCTTAMEGHLHATPRR